MNKPRPYLQEEPWFIIINKPRPYLQVIILFRLIYRLPHWKYDCQCITQSRIIDAILGPTLNYGERLSLYISHMLLVNMTLDLAHLQLSDLQEKIRPTCQTSDLQKEKILIRRTKWLFSLLKKSQDSLTYFYIHFIFIFFILRCFTY